MSETKMHYFTFHFQKFLAATKGWKDDEVGAFVKLLIEQFDRGYVPDDLQEIDRLITSRKKNWKLLAKKFSAPSEPGQLRNAFMITVRNEAHEKSAKNAASGALGGRAKKANAIANGTANGKANANKTLQRNGSQPVTSSQEPVPNKENVVVRDVWFEMFRRACGAHISDDDIFLEVGKFRNKYPNQHPNQAGGLINAWVSRIGSEVAKETESPKKKMVL